MIRAILATSACALLLAATARAESALDFDFEKGPLGEPPAGWTVADSAGAELAAEVSSEEPFEGERCAAVRRPSGGEGFGNLMRAVDASPFRGKRVRLSAAVRAPLPPSGPSRAQLWMRVDRAEGRRGFFDNMQDRPIRAADWRRYEIVGEVAGDALHLHFGMMLLGSGQAWLDDVRLEVLGEAGEGYQPPRALEGRAVENLVAFARLFGYVRFFHPSDEAAAADWERFARIGVREVESAADPAELAASLRALFAPIAPTLEVYALPEGDSASSPTPRVGSEPPAGATRYRAWHHRGFGFGAPQQTYRSTRLEVKIPDPDVLLPRTDRRAKRAPRPSEVHEAELGGGVGCRLPLALWADAEGTLPRATAERRIDEPEGFVASGDDRASRLAGVVLAWNVFQHFYPYFDTFPELETDPGDWRESLRRSLETAALDPDAAAFAATLERLVAGLHDGHGGVSFEQRNTQLPLLWEWVEGQLVITRVADGEAEGLRPGDAVLAIDGRPAAEALAELEGRISGATPQWRRWRALGELLRSGPDRTALEVEGLAGERRTLVLARDHPAWGEGALQSRARPPIDEPRPGVIYLDLDRVDDETFAAALPRMEAARALVFDLRGYPKVTTKPLAHLVDEPVSSARWLVPVVTRPDRQAMEFEPSSWQVEPQEPHLRAPAAFLIDGRAISYAETYLGIVEHYRLAELVGSPTAGTNGNVSPFTLPGGYRLSWTGMKVLKHDGSRHHGVGIRPTIPAAPTRAGIAAGRDEVLERAIEALLDGR